MWDAGEAASSTAKEGRQERQDFAAASVFQFLPHSRTHKHTSRHGDLLLNQSIKADIGKRKKKTGQSLLFPPHVMILLSSSSSSFK